MYTEMSKFPQILYFDGILIFPANAKISFWIRPRSRTGFYSRYAADASALCYNTQNDAGGKAWSRKF
jgi:hypothetical protein